MRGRTDKYVPTETDRQRITKIETELRKHLDQKSRKKMSLGAITRLVHIARERHYMGGCSNVK
jgi:hypothetical protein